MDDQLFMQRYWQINALILLIAGLFVFPANDSYYYWTWSQHLQLSYFDGPPLIAYLLWISTHIFGNNFFALNLVSILCTYGSTYLIYKIVSLMSNKNMALVAALLWMMYPFATTRFIAVSMTLDGLEVFFSLLIIYSAFLWIKYRQTRYIYFLSIAIGMGMLAKYNVVILLLAIIVYFLFDKDLRKIYLSPHLYVGMLIAILIFSPVIIWNYQNHWVSFSYQLNSHKWTGGVNAINSASKHGLPGMWFYIGSCVFGVLHILLLIMFYLKFIKKITIADDKYNKGVIFSIYVILLFWLYQSYSAHVGLNYMVTVSALICIIVGQQLAAYPKFTKVLLVLFSLITIIMLIDKSRIPVKYKNELANYNKYVTSGMVHRPFMN
jgi:4-amino-4-deoxy-L-arabinose transferase-like glycosyltransferase